LVEVASLFFQSVTRRWCCEVCASFYVQDGIYAGQWPLSAC